MLEEFKNITSTKKDLRNFGLIIGIVLFLIAAFLFIKENPAYQYVLITGSAFIVIGLVMSIILKPLYLVWMAIAVIIGWIMTRVILSVMYYVILTPTGLLLRLFGKQFLDLRWDTSKNTYWNYRSDTTIKKEGYENQF